LLDDLLASEWDDDPGQHFMDNDDRPSERDVYDEMCGC